MYRDENPGMHIPNKMSGTGTQATTQRKGEKRSDDKQSQFLLARRPYAHSIKSYTPNGNKSRSRVRVMRKTKASI